MQYVPRDGLYVYFRYDANQTILCVMNTGDHAATVDFTRYAERTAGFTRAKDVLSGRLYEITVGKGVDDPRMDVKLEIPPMDMRVLELMK